MRFSLDRLLMLVLVIAVQIPLVPSARAQTRIERSGTTVVNALSPKGKATVTIHTTIFNRTCACSCPAAWALKESNLKEMSVVQGFEISVGGKSIVSPDTAYDHLFEPHEALLRFENGSFILRIDGEDASNSYFVQVYFDREGVNRFVTYWSLVPDKPTSDTHYFHVELK